MKRIKHLLPALLLCSFASFSAFAGQECGAGRITHIVEGHNNTEDLLIAIDYEVGGHPGGFLVQDRYIRFQKDVLSPDVFRGIKAIIYMAYSTDSYVFVKAQGAFACGGANYIRILKPGTPLDPPLPLPES